MNLSFVQVTLAAAVDDVSSFFINNASFLKFI